MEGVFANTGTIQGGVGGDQVGYGGTFKASNSAANGGVGVLLSGGTLENSGVINGGNPGANYTGHPGKKGDGLRLVKPGSVTNGSTSNHAAYIFGAVGVDDRGGGGVTLDNFGTVAGAYESVLFRNANDLVTAESGSVFKGEMVGDGGTLEMAGGTGAINSLGASASVLSAR